MISKKRYKLAAVLMCGLLLASCVRDPFETPGGPSGGKVRLELKLDIATDSQGIASRAATTEEQEKALDAERVYILVADGVGENAVLKQKPVRAKIIENSKIYALLSEEKSESYIYVVANVPTTAVTYLNGLEGTELISDITSSLMLSEPTRVGVQAPFPMTGVSGAIARIDKGTVLPSSATSVPLVRAVARIDVKIDAAVTPENFTITGVTLANGAKKAWLFPQTEVEAQKDMNVLRYNEATDVNGANAITHQIYLYQNNGHLGTYQYNPTRIIVKGYYKGATTDSYYGIDIAYRLQSDAPTAELRYDIERNKAYTVNLRKIDSDGYSTFEEAARSEAFNTSTESDIVVTDPYAYNIVTNGKQYLGVTNSELVIFPLSTTDAIKNVVVATISYTTEPNWSLGRITLPAGVTFVEGTNERLNLGSGSAPVIREIQVDVASSFVTGDIKIHIGDLSKTIKVTRKTTITPAAGGVLLDYALTISGGVETPKTEYVAGEIISASASNAWLKVSMDEEGLDPSSLQDKITNPAGQIFIHMSGNVGFSASTKAREAQLYIAGRSDDQRIRVHVQQNTFDVYYDNKPIEPFSYVGVYHRWNQTGERIIRIDASANGTSHWEATVVHGDFILLSTSESKDGGIDETNAYGTNDRAIYTSDDDIEAMCQVDDGARNIRGNTSHIYFKVGLTGKLASASAQPRYGLIAISHGGGIHFIYVRQGEEPDYLMRPWDAVDYTGVAESEIKPTIRYPMSNRPSAVKMGVYNLKDRENREEQVNAGTRAYGFVKYPSQGGYYFTKDGSTAIHPMATVTSLTKKPVSGYQWVESYESCPTGYRRPNDGTNQLAVARRSGVVLGSEVRQSLWLYPMLGDVNSNFSNQLKGYLADGYFDRRPITASETKPGGGQYANAVVSNNTVDVAYWGYLVFNPINYASIFMPLSGAYEFSSPAYKVKDRGVFAGIMTSSSEAAINCRIVNYGYIINEGFASAVDVFDTYGTTGIEGSYPIRCVRDERPPVAGGGIIVDEFEPGTTLTTHSIVYTTGHGSFQAQLEEHLTVASATRDNINALLITGNARLTADDYKYLNDWVDESHDLTSPLKLQHVTIRSAANTVLPTGAITSDYWMSITLPDVITVEAGAFNPSGNNGAANLRLCSFDPITIAADAFGAHVDTSQVNLYLSGVEYERADKTALTWAGRSWKSIKEY